MLTEAAGAIVDVSGLCDFLRRLLSCTHFLGLVDDVLVRTYEVTSRF